MSRPLFIGQVSLKEFTCLRRKTTHPGQTDNGMGVFSSPDDNDFETEKIKIKPKIKLSHNKYTLPTQEMPRRACAWEEQTVMATCSKRKTKCYLFKNIL